MDNKELEKKFIRIYSEIHSELNMLENEIENHLKNKNYLLDNDEKLEDLKKRTAEAISLLEKTRDEERIIFKYGS